MRIFGEIINWDTDTFCGMSEVCPTFEVYHAGFLVRVTVVRKIVAAHRAVHTDAEPRTLFDCHAINQRA